MKAGYSTSMVEIIEGKPRNRNIKEYLTTGKPRTLHIFKNPLMLNLTIDLVEVHSFGVP